MALTITTVRPTPPMPAAMRATAAAARPADTFEPTHPGPVPDYAAMSGIVAHALLRDLCQPLVNVLFDTLGPRFQLATNGVGGGSFGSSGPDRSLLWMRDYHATFVRQANGSLKVVAFASPNPNRNQMVGSDYIPVPIPGPGQEFFRPVDANSGPGRWLEVQRLPLIHEDGNLVSTGEYAFCTDKLFDDNAQEHGEKCLKVAGYRPRSADEVRQMFCQALNIAPDHLIVMPRMPGEKTGHQDMYLMALGPREVMLPNIPNEALGVLTMGHEIDMGRTVQSFLDEQAKKLEEQGFKVNRLPMMAPTFLTPAADSPAGWWGHFDSPANGLLANVEQTHEVVLPTVKLDGFPPEYKALADKYHSQGCDFFRTKGYEPHLVDGTDLQKANGLFRCVTFPIPA